MNRIFYFNYLDLYLKIKDNINEVGSNNLVYEFIYYNYKWVYIDEISKNWKSKFLPHINRKK